MRKIAFLGAAFVATTALADHGAKVSGYADAGYKWAKGGTNTFLVNEGAVYVHGDMDGAKAMIDLGFMGNDGSTTAFSFAPKSQAYVYNEYDNGFHWKMGQFDSLFGSEGKDSKDIPFTYYSMITTQIMPWNHVGMDIGYSVGDWQLHMLIANPTLGSSTGQWADYTQTAGNPDFGLNFQGSIGDTMTEISGGLLFGRSGSTKRVLASGILEFTFGDLVIRGDGFFRKMATGNNELGAGGYALYNMSDDFSAGIRLAFAGKQVSPDDKLQLTIGPQMRMTKHLVTKLDYTMDKPVSGSAGHTVRLNGVYSF